MTDVVFGRVAVLAGSGDPYLTGVTDLTIVRGPSGPLLYVTSGPGGGIAVYDMTGGRLVLSDRFSLPAQGTTGVDSTLIITDLGAKEAVLVTGVSGSGLWAVGLDAAGDLSARVTLNLTLPADLMASHVVTVGGTDYLYGLRLGSSAISVWRIGEDGRLTAVSQPSSAQPPSAGPVLTDLATVASGGQTWLLATSAGSDALISYRIGSNGVPTEVDRVWAAEGLGISDPVAVATATLGGRAYAVFASAGTGTLTVAEVRTDGTLSVTDHVMDDLGTRFQDAAIVETITIGGRVYVVAAGADDGLTLMELLPGGRLIDLGSQADTTAIGLNNVAAVALSESGGDLQIAVASGREAGVTWLSVDLATGQILNGTGAADKLSGGSGDDLLTGGSGNDRLSGGGGRDVIVDGAGIDTLAGGSGADRFVMDYDNQVDVITDFNPAEDSIDLSAWSLLRSVDQLKIKSTGDGAQIRFGDEVVNIHTSSGQSLSVAAVQSLDLIGLSRIGPGWVEPVTPPQTFYGTSGTDVPLSSDASDLLYGAAGNDSLYGGLGNDTLYGGDGNDRIEGGDGNDALRGDAGNDVLRGGAGNDRIEGGNGTDTLWGGTGNDLLYGQDSMDTLSLEDGRDTAYGGAGSDTVTGGEGDDAIWGGTESDQLDGQGGNDTLDGDDGRDTLRGGTGNDWLYGDTGNDLLYGDDGNDSLTGDDGTDTLWGGAGNDRLGGGNGNDWLYGGDATDSLTGGAGNDTLNGDAGNDWLYGEAGNDRLVGAAGDDRISGDDGTDQLSGSDGNDTLYGGAGNDSLYGDGGNDRLQGGTGNDMLSGGAGVGSLYGEDGNDILKGGSGTDSLYGGAGNDSLYGDAGNDRLWGGDANDRLQGDAGNDTLYGDAGNDLLYGGDGNDRLEGMSGNDQMFGGAGADSFVFTSGQDRIADFSNNTDTILIDDALWGGKTRSVADLLEDAVVTSSGTRISFSNGQWLLIEGLTNPSLLRDDIAII